MIRRNTNRFFLGIALVGGFVTAVVMLAGPLSAQVQVPIQASPPETSPDRPDRPKTILQVGTYDPEAVFQKHPDREELMEALNTAQTRMQEAQQEEDHMKMQQIQQQFEQARERVIQKFQEDINRALPKVAKAAGVKVVVREIVYKADDVKDMDLTPHLVKAFAEDDKDKSDPPVLPRFPRESETSR